MKKIACAVAAVAIAAVLAGCGNPDTQGAASKSGASQTAGSRARETSSQSSQGA